MSKLDIANALLKYNLISQKEYAEILSKGLKQEHFEKYAELLSKGKK